MKKKQTDRLRIAMLGHKHAFSREGGVEVEVGELAARLAQRGQLVTLFDRSPRAKGLTRPEIPGLRIR